MSEDLKSSGDITTKLIKNNKKIKAKIISNQNCVVGGLNFAKETFKYSDKKVIFKTKIKDGKKINKEWFDVFVTEDFEAVSAYYAEEVEYQSAFYGGPIMNREETLNYLKGWQDAMEDITWEAVNYLPGADPETGLPNGSVRTYGYWSGTNTASGKSFRGLWYHYLTFDEDGKIVNGGDFGDATGLVMAVAPDEE